MLDVYQIVTYEQPSIRERSVEVAPEKITTPEFQAYLDRINHTMDMQINAAGLASPQCGLNRRVIAVQLKQIRQIMINPQLTKVSAATTETEEGCFSVPGVYGLVTRPKRVTVKFLDRHGRRAELDLKNFDAVVVQHEIDHLDGILFVDKVTKITRGEWPVKE